MSRSFAILLSLSSYLSPLIAQPSYTLVENQAHTAVLTPDLKSRKTLKMRLANGLEVYLIYDPRADKSAASLIVKVGSWSEPATKPGLAHFLEHMLFLGTQQYPEENGYANYISLHGGMLNAFTTNDATAYLFSIDNDALEGALDRFSSFFKTPLFNAGGVSRELNAIDQEFAKNLLNDTIRQYHVFKQLRKPSHPESLFHMGNSESLATTTPKDLKEWYESNYSADRMALTVYSPLPLEQLKEWVVAKFGSIAVRPYTPLQDDTAFTLPSAYKKILFIEPVKNTRTLTMVWELPKHFILDDSHPDKTVCFVLGHEGANSLLAQLKSEGLATGVVCGLAEYTREHRELALQLELTPAGLQNYSTVVERVFQALAGLRQTGIPEAIFTEQQREQLLSYQYQGRREAFEEVFYHALHLDHEPLETYPEKQELLTTYRPKLVQELLDYLTPDHSVIVLQAPERETGVTANQKEPYLDISYTLIDTPQVSFSRWKKALPHPNIHLPAANAFIATDLSLITPPKKQQQQDATDNRGVPLPQVLVDTERAKVYYAADTLYKVPQVALDFTIKTPAITSQYPATMALADLYTKCVNEALANLSYNAMLAGLTSDIKSTDKGIELQIAGFNDKALSFLESVTEALAEPVCNDDLFYRFKDILLREYADARLKLPIEQAAERLKSILFEHYATSSDKEQALRSITLSDYHTFKAGLYSENFVKGVVYGNMTAEQAKQAVDIVQKALAGKAYPPARHEKRKILILPQKSGPFYYESTLDVAGNSILLAIEGGAATHEKRAVQQIAMQVLQEGFYNALRTQQQTAYLVMSQDLELEGELVDILGEQSNSHDNRDLLARFELYLEEFLRNLETSVLPEDRFKELQQALTIQISQPPHTLEEMAQLIETLAFTYDGDFKRPTQRIEAFKALSYATFVKETRNMLGRDNHRRLAILLYGSFPDGKSPFRYQPVENGSWLKQKGIFTDRQALNSGSQTTSSPKPLLSPGNDEQPRH
jgi:insulysin